jgi:rRNA maturation RNase YbeY
LIQFFEEDISFRIKRTESIRHWIRKVAEMHGNDIHSLNYIYCSDPYLLKINRERLGHDFLTDIITFDLSEEEKILEADIYISIDRVQENATNLSVPFESELYRVMIHGVLHLLGFDDKSEEEKLKMRKKEDACLSLLH